MNEGAIILHGCLAHHRHHSNNSNQGQFQAQYLAHEIADEKKLALRVLVSGSMLALLLGLSQKAHPTLR